MALVINSTVTGLKTNVFNLPNAGNYTIQCTLQLPNVDPSATQGPGGGAGTGTGGAQRLNSQVVTVIKKNSSTIYTSAAGDRGLLFGIESASAGDTISVILSSSLSQDQQPQAVQCTVSIWEGEAR